MSYIVKNTVAELREIADDIREAFPNLTEAESANVAIQHQHNRILMLAHVISTTDSYPSALEAIAIQLGEISGKPIKVNIK